jgi:hypothetical protein
MERRPPAIHERKDRISKVTVEPEKPYGIYLPDWNSLAHAFHAFAASEYQSTAPLSREETVYEYESRTKGNRARKGFKQYSKYDLLDFVNFYGEPALPEQVEETLQKIKSHFDNGDTMQLDDNIVTRGALQINNGDNEFFLGGRTFYKTRVTIEALRSENKKTDNPKEHLQRYTEPYLLTIYSKLNNENPEATLIQATGAEQAALSRRVKVLFLPEGYAQIDRNAVAQRLNTALHNNGDQAKISGVDLLPCFNLKDPQTRSLGVYDGLRLQVRKYEPQHMLAPNRLQVGLEFIISDPRVESQAYSKTNLIPPEKRQAAQTLTETIATAFSS